MSETNPYAIPSSSPQDEETSFRQHDPRQLPFASRGERFLGNLIDTLVLMPVIVVFVVLGFAFPNSFDFESVFFEILSSVIVLVGMVAVQGYFWKTRSQSIGKIVMKTQIVDLDGSPADFNTICWKRTIPISIVTMVPGIGGGAAILNALLIFREQHNCLHDDIASTRVIKLLPPDEQLRDEWARYK